MMHYSVIVRRRLVSTHTTIMFTKIIATTSLVLSIIALHGLHELSEDASFIETLKNNTKDLLDDVKDSSKCVL